MVKKLLYIILLLKVATPGHAQKSISIEVQAWANVRLAALNSGWDAGRNGGGLSLGVHKQFKEIFIASASGEIGAAGIGNYLAVKAGAGKPIGLGTSRWVYTPGFHLLQGMALARPHPLYMWGLEQSNAIDFKLKNASGPGFVFGFRFYGFPGYSKYSEVHSFVDLKAGLRYTF